MSHPLPPAYAWLKRENGPRILIEALELFGTIEKPGPDDNPVILLWAKEIGGWIGDFYQHDSVPWCGLFMAVCAKRAGFPFNQKALSAQEWVKWGRPSDYPMLGDVLVFTRTGGGHVGLYVGEDREAYHVLGGNQADQVCITRLAKSRITTARRCAWRDSQPGNVRPVHLQPGGSNLSRNEG